MNEKIHYIKFAKHLSDISSDVIKKYFRTNIRVEKKEDHSPVTAADMQAEELMREAILKEFPDHGIIGEEFGNHEGKSEYTWVLDPIDGTKSFISGAICFGTLIALLQNGEPALGFFNQPILDEFLWGNNETAQLNDKTVFIRNCDQISEATLLTTDHLNNELYHNARSFNELIREVKIYRNWGDCYGYYLLATGFADIMLDPIMSLWDIAALVPIVRGAGGIITDFQGNNPLKGNSIIASNLKLHSQIIERFKNS